jgi:hypothetical protein
MEPWCSASEFDFFLEATDTSPVADSMTTRFCISKVRTHALIAPLYLSADLLTIVLQTSGSIVAAEYEAGQWSS